MALDVVGMRIAAPLVVRRDDVGTELANHLDQSARRLFERNEGEAPFGQRRKRVALGKPGIDETEPALLHAQDASGLGQMAKHGGQNRQRCVRVRPWSGYKKTSNLSKSFSPMRSTTLHKLHISC